MFKMPRRKMPGEEKSIPHSFSVEDSVYKDFETYCSERGTGVSAEIAKFMKKCLKKDKKEKRRADKK